MRINYFNEAMLYYHKNYKLTNCASQARVAVQLKMKMSAEQSEQVQRMYELMQELSQGDNND